VSAPVDREQLRRDLSDALSAIQKEHSVVGLDVLAGSLSVLGGQYAFHGRLILKALEPVPINYNAAIWNVLKALELLEKEKT
jgi:hypothetical protein